MCAACVGAAIGEPEIVAHRGASHDAPENTLAAFNLAWEKGADSIEGDFWLTKDEEIVCTHDRRTERVADRNLRIAESTLEELRTLDVGSWKGPDWKGERIPTIGEVFATVPEGKRILIEIKCGPEILGPLEEAIATSGLQAEQMIIISFDADVVAGAKQKLPHLKAFWITDFEIGEKTGKWKPSVDEILATLKRIDADGVDCKAHRVVDRGFVERLREADMELHVWTINDPSTAKRFRDLGVDSITTDRPGWIKEQLRRLLRRMP